MRTLTYKNRGFTLTELLVVIFISTLIMLGIVSLYLAQDRLTKGEVNQSYAQTRLGATLNDLKRLGSQATTILSSVVINSTTYTTDADTLVLSLPAIDSSNNVIADVYDSVVFERDGNDDLAVITEAGVGSSRVSGTKILIDQIEPILVNYENNVTPSESSWLDLTLEQVVAGTNEDKSISLTYKIYLKNKTL